MSYSICSTKKLLDRITPAEIVLSHSSSTLLGNWYATAMFWRPQVALLINEKTLLPVLMPLAPASDLGTRFPTHAAAVFKALSLSPHFLDYEIAQMRECHYAKTSNRSVVGVMNQFIYLAEAYRKDQGQDDLVSLSLRLADTPTSSLYKTSICPNREVTQVVAAWLTQRTKGVSTEK
jgi:hypothetical protein